jgi:hypothetical protein
MSMEVFEQREATLRLKARLEAVEQMRLAATPSIGSDVLYMQKFALDYLLKV